MNLNLRPAKIAFEAEARWCARSLMSTGLAIEEVQQYSGIASK